MSSFKSASLLKDSSLVVTAGTRPHAVRNSLKLAAVALVIATASSVAFAAPAQAQNYSNQHQVVQNPPIPATVVSVHKVNNHSNSNDVYERRQEQYADRTNRLVGTAVGSVLGNVLGDKVGSGSGRWYARALGAIGGGVVGNKLGQWTDKRRSNTQTEQAGNVRYVQNAYEVVVNLQLGGGQVEQVAITQSNGEFRRGDQVVVVSNNDGTANVVASQYSPSVSSRYGR